MLPDIGLQPLGYLSSICDKIQDLETMYTNIIVFTHRKATWCRLLYWTSGVFPLCCHLCSKSAIAVICGIINFMWVLLQDLWLGTTWMNTMFEGVRLSVTAPLWRLAFRITDYSFFNYDQHCK